MQSALAFSRSPSSGGHYTGSFHHHLLEQNAGLFQYFIWMVFAACQCDVSHGCKDARTAAFKNCPAKTIGPEFTKFTP
jgi:hypothetical protein